MLDSREESPNLDREQRPRSSNKLNLFQNGVCGPPFVLDLQSMTSALTGKRIYRAIGTRALVQSLQDGNNDLYFPEQL